jgi:hypothetical protein
VQTTGSDAAKYQVYKTDEKCFADHTRILLSNIKGKNAKYSYIESLNIYKQDHNLKNYIHNVALSYAYDLDWSYTYKILNIMGTLKIKFKVTEVEVEEPDEFSKAFDLMVRLEVFKPYGDLDTYKDKLINRRELAVLLARLVQHLEA